VTEDDPLGRALRVVGARWSLLVVHELLSRGPLRFADLRSALRGISPNTLSLRLRALTEDGVVTRRLLPPPAASWVYEVTDHGRRLSPAIEVLTDWGRATAAGDVDRQPPHAAAGRRNQGALAAPGPSLERDTRTVEGLS
jgi:DNA-binding HxlR family transcriptional regulator